MHAGASVALRVLGVLCIGFAIIDIVAARAFDTDLTGVGWSPIVAGVLGMILLRVARFSS